MPNQPWLQESKKWWPRWRLGLFCRDHPFCNRNRKKTILILISNPEAHLHNRSGLQATSPIRSDPAFLLETLPKTVDPDTQIPGLHIAKIFIILLNCFLSETCCGLSQFCWNSPTVLFWATYTSQCASPPWNWQVTAASPQYQGGAEYGVKTNLAAGTGRYERVWAIWNDAGTSELRWKKAATKKTRAFSSLTCLFMNVSLERILASVY